MQTLAHIINPVNTNETSDLFIAQPITFETMRIARKYARNQVDVNFFSAQYREDRAMLPEGFTITPDLERSVLDIATFKKKRKLPLIKDILDRLYAATDAEYLIYTNVDISLMPHFYVALNNIIEKGYDAFTVNRRTISKKYKIKQLASMYAETGEPHPGHDCFVFKRSLYPNFNLGSACIGANWVGRVLITNLICHSEQLEIFKDMHLTFHIGDDQSWRVSEYSDYDKHNESQLHKILLDYKASGLFNGKPLVEEFLQYIEKKNAISDSNNQTDKLNVVSCIITKLKRFIKDALTVHGI